MARALVARAAANASSKASGSLRRTAVASFRASGTPSGVLSTPIRAMSSSSRFQKLADDDDEEGGRRRKKRAEDGEEDDEEGDEEEGEDAELEGEEGAEGEEEGDEDGDLELEDHIEINEGGVDIDEELDDEVMRLYMENPLKWTPEKLARRFYLSKPRVEAIIYLKAEDAGLSPEEFRAKVAEAKEAARVEIEAHARLIEDAKAKGDEKELRRLLKRDRQAEEAEAEDEEEFDEHETAMLLGLDDDAYRNPDFFFLSDEFEGLPPLVRRMGKHGSTDQLYPAEAKELQRLAANNVVTPQKSFSNPANAKVSPKFRLAVKDISKKKKALYVRDQSRELRLATNEEVLQRSWVRRPPFFDGLEE